MPYTYAIYDTISGDFQANVTPATNSMGRRLNSYPEGASSFAPDPDLTPSDWTNLLRPWSRVLVKCRNDVPVAAHVFTKETESLNSSLANMSHADIGAIWARRSTFGSNGYSGNQPTDNQLDVVNRTLAAMPSWLIWASTNGPTALFDLPMYLPEGKITDTLVHSLPTTGPHTRIWRDDEIPFVDGAWSEVQSTKGGPDTELVPQLVGGKLRWLLRSGALTGVTRDFVMGAPECELFDVSRTVDGSKQANVVYAIGNGSERKLLVASAYGTPTVPALERAIEYREIGDMAVLQDHADADLALYNQPIVQWTASVHADAMGGIETIPLGSTLRLYFQGHWRIPDGWHTMRLIGFDTDQTEKVTLQLQPTGGV